jgi:O-antigen ligase
MNYNKLTLILFILLFVIGASIILIPNGVSALFPISLMTVILYLIMTKPKWFLYITLSLWTLKGFVEIPGQFTAFHSIQFNLSGFLNALIIFAGVVYYLKKRKKIFFNKLVITFFIFLAMCGFSLLYTDDFTQGIRFLTRITCPFVFFYVVYSEINEKKEVSTLLTAILISSAVPLGMGFFQLITGTGLKDPVGLIRLQALFEHPNSFSFYLVILFYLTFTFLFRKQPRWTFFLFFVLNVIVALQLIYTYCRSAWIAGAVGCLLMIFRYRKKWRIITSYLVILVVSILSITAIKKNISPSEISMLKTPGQIQRSGQTLDRISSIRWRLKTWSYLLKKVPDSLFIGKGAGSAKSPMKDYYNRDVHPHNIFIRIIYDTGLVGLGLFILFLFFLYRQGLFLLPKSKTDMDFQIISIFAASIIALSIIMLSDNIFEQHSSSLYYWTFFALGNQMMMKPDQNEEH